MRAKLLYFGTDDEIRVGDRVEYRTFFLRRKVPGIVVHIPEKTARELDDEKKPPEDWLIKLDDGTYTGWMYFPEELPASSRLKLLSRGAAYEPVTPAELERQEAEENEKRGLHEDLLGCGLLLAIAFAIIMLIAIIKYGLPW